MKVWEQFETIVPFLFINYWSDEKQSGLILYEFVWRIPEGITVPDYWWYPIWPWIPTEDRIPGTIPRPGR